MGRASREKRLRKQRDAADQALLRRVIATSDVPVALRNSSRDIPVSERITDLIGPELDQIGSDDERARALIMLAVSAWNIGALPGGWADAKAEGTLANLPSDVMGLMRVLVDRKLERCPEDHRFVLDYEITDLPDGPRLSVVSANLDAPAGPPETGTVQAAG